LHDRVQHPKHPNTVHDVPSLPGMVSRKPICREMAYLTTDPVNQIVGTRLVR
jgi:hypothetical protein